MLFQKIKNKNQLKQTTFKKKLILNQPIIAHGSF